MSELYSQPGRTFSAFDQRFSSTRRGARLARLLAALHFAEWGLVRGADGHEAATAVVAELTSNAVLHGRVPGRDFALRLTYDGVREVVRVEVADTHDARPVLGRPADDTDGGRGLMLVDAFAVRWGVRDRSGPGKTVWAECSLADRAGAAH
ncbi:ATP-binding protein [Streptomyces sp. NPDC048590]|uniref:ATP-binding protein n=1 Tax=Streptomyces sp. NPDC048590 TaxID=3365574 RepID=UPI0037154888